MTALLVQEVGFDGVSVGGGSIANIVYGVPDMGLISPGEILDAAGRVCGTVSVPLIADIDYGERPRPISTARFG